MLSHLMNLVIDGPFISLQIFRNPGDAGVFNSPIDIVVTRESMRKEIIAYCKKHNVRASFYNSATRRGR